MCKSTPPPCSSGPVNGYTAEELGNVLRNLFTAMVTHSYSAKVLQWASRALGHAAKASTGTGAAVTPLIMR